eukprot:TRINITY_DN10698_c0_g1_i13.p1 TRINITY_DN10698_c0_g1~~TRINITY_DN10698_c0_g1_i13.p1  ORF type:complete len:402 (+),score=48.86 TRINITY_DN10698_c0_g1_i13:155-1360(+)
MLGIFLALLGVYPFLGFVDTQNVFVTNLGQNSINPLGRGQLYKGICEGEVNCVYSPYSLFLALSMLVEGADGVTLEELNDLLNEYDPDLILELIERLDQTSSDYTLDSVNAIYTSDQHPVNAEYQSKVEGIFKANVGTLDFFNEPEESRVTINSDIGASTKGEITDLLPVGSITSDTILVLTNALYFKATWLVQFDPANTEDKDFFVSPTNPIQVPTMSVSGRFRTSILPTGVLLVELPYSLGYTTKPNWDMSMVIVLPAEGDDLVVEKYTEDAVDMINGLDKVPEQQVNIQIPKFEIEFDAGSLRSDLEQLGLKSLFNPAQADLSGISDSKVYVSDVFHKAKVQIDEEGTVAAAATAVILDFESVVEELDIVINRPFGFMIIYQPAAAVLFTGKVGNPSI